MRLVQCSHLLDAGGHHGSWLNGAGRHASAFTKKFVGVCAASLGAPPPRLLVDAEVQLRASQAWWQPCFTGAHWLWQSAAAPAGGGRCGHAVRGNRAPEVHLARADDCGRCHRLPSRAAGALKVIQERVPWWPLSQPSMTENVSAQFNYKLRQ